MGGKCGYNASVRVWENRETEETVRLCLKYRCPCDITLKDISTVSYRPENLIIWAETASSVLDQYYGEA